MEGLDPSAEHLGLTGIIGHLGHVQSRGDQRRTRTAAGEQLDALPGEETRQFDQALLVEDTQQGAPNHDHILTHGSRSRFVNFAELPATVFPSEADLKVLEVRRPSPDSMRGEGRDQVALTEASRRPLS